MSLEAWQSWPVAWHQEEEWEGKGLCDHLGLICIGPTSPSFIQCVLFFKHAPFVE